MAKCDSMWPPDPLLLLILAADKKRGKTGACVPPVENIECGIMFLHLYLHLYLQPLMFMFSLRVSPAKSVYFHNLASLLNLDERGILIKDHRVGLQLQIMGEN